MYFEQARLAHKQHKNVFKIEIKADGDAVPTLDGNAIERGEPSLNESVLESQVSDNRSAQVSNRGGIKKMKTTRAKKIKYSFNSSDIEAYNEE